MSLLDGQDLIKIKLYYTYLTNENGRKLVILSDEKAEKMLKDEKTKEEVETLVTEWSILNWKEQNEVIEISSKAINPQTGDKQFDFIAYRDSIIKRCLKSWDITTDDGAKVPVTPENIDRLPGQVVLALFSKFDTFLEYSEEDLGN